MPILMGGRAASVLVRATVPLVRWFKKATRDESKGEVVTPPPQAVPVTQVSQRLLARITTDFEGSPDPIGAVVELVESAQESERILAAIVLLAEGDIDRLLDAIELAETDWRDVLVAAGLANEDWSEKLTNWLGPSS